MNYKKRTITYHREKAEFISNVSQENREMLFLYDEDPRDYLPEEIRLQRFDQRKYIIYPPYSYEPLMKWLQPGNWQAVSPAIESYAFVDSFRSSYESIQNHLENHRVELMIDSFHDDIEWNVFSRR